MSEETPPKDTRLIREITLRNILSFGPDTPPFELRPLNVLIGPNGSGKSNFLNAIALMRQSRYDNRSLKITGGDQNQFMAMRGGVKYWLWGGIPTTHAWVSAIFDQPERENARAYTVEHQLSFTDESSSMRIMDESIFFNGTLFYSFDDGNPSNLGIGKRVRIDRDISPRRSVVSQLSDDKQSIYFGLSELYGEIQIYNDWEFGRTSALRLPQQPDLPSIRLEEDFSNLKLFLSKLRQNPVVRVKLIDSLSNLYDGITDFEISVEANTVQVSIIEGNYPIPATRLSDGTLRYLCLLAILCDPEPPPLICIEEPELGLHPDIVGGLAKLLIEASTRTQIIVTTHSDILVDALSDTPEAIIVCEKHDGKTEMERLKADELAPFLEKYRLGELWTRGQLGGNRW